MNLEWKSLLAEGGGQDSCGCPAALANIGVENAPEDTVKLKFTDRRVKRGG